MANAHSHDSHDAGHGSVKSYAIGFILSGLLAALVAARRLVEDCKGLPHDQRRREARLQQRARIVLLAATGLQNKEIADRLGIGRVQVARWRQRYLESGIEGIERDLPRSVPSAKPAPSCGIGRSTASSLTSCATSGSRVIRSGAVLR